MYTKFQPARAHLAAHLLWAEQQAASLAPYYSKSYRAQEDELLLPATFLPEAIKYVFIRQGNRDLQLTGQPEEQ